MLFKRKIYQEILNWKNESNGKTGLLIEGARRVGKSTIVEEFAKNEYKSYILIDFDKEGDEIKEIFSHGFGNLDSLFMSLSVYYQTNLYPRESLIIFDEVQKFPRVHEGMKYLVNDGRYDFIETGSLITLKLLNNEITNPSEVIKIAMYPMDFEEFLWTLNDEVTIPFLKEHFEKKIPLGNAVHRKILSLFRTYMAIGGLPQAIEQYLEDKINLSKVDKIKRNILDLYSLDLKKYDNKYKTITSEIFEKIPSFLMNKNGLFLFSNLNNNKNNRYNNLIHSIEGIKKSMVSIIVNNVSEPSIALSLNEIASKMKIYQADIGLLITQTLKSKKETNTEIYKKIIFDKLSLNNGMYFENAVAEILTSNGHNLHYFKFKEENKETNKINNYEIDFLIERKGKITPIEVKSSSYKNHKSLDIFLKKFKDKNIGEAYVIYSKDLYNEENSNITYIPIYMSMFL